MIRRVVKMSFQEDRIEDFLVIFKSAKQKIRRMPGCHYLSLHRDHHRANTYYTLSHWENQEALDRYRETELFKTTWAATKLLFNDKPQAFSLDLVDEVN